MTKHIGNGDELFEDKFARVYAEVRRMDQLRDVAATAAERLAQESYRRLDQRMDAQETAVAAALAAAEKAVTAALTAADKAVGKAELAQAKVNETQNEFRGTLRDQATSFMPRSETENLIRELRGLIIQNANQFTELRSRVDVGPPALSTLQARSDELAGHERGVTDAERRQLQTRNFVFGVIGVAGLVYGIISRIH